MLSPLTRRIGYLSEEKSSEAIRLRSISRPTFIGLETAVVVS